MLVLARKEHESLEFPELGVVIRVVSLKRTKVQLGIDAPQRIKVRRTELPPEASEVEPTARNLSRRFDSHRLSHELDRLEAQIAALSELASRSNQELAKQVVADSQIQIDKINRLLVSVSDSTTETQSNETAWSMAPDINGACVRQNPAEFTIGNSPRHGGVEPIYQMMGEKAVWFPGLLRQRDRAIA